jgi:hypothetical protein
VYGAAGPGVAMSVTDFWTQGLKRTGRDIDTANSHSKSLALCDQGAEALQNWDVLKSNSAYAPKVCVCVCVCMCAEPTNYACRVIIKPL